VQFWPRLVACSISPLFSLQTSTSSDQFLNAYRRCAVIIDDVQTWKITRNCDLGASLILHGGRNYYVDIFGVLYRYELSRKYNQYLIISWFFVDKLPADRKHFFTAIGRSLESVPNVMQRWATRTISSAILGYTTRRSSSTFPRDSGTVEPLANCQKNSSFLGQHYFCQNWN
jgi:hypothetical protein